MLDGFRRGQAEPGCGAVRRAESLRHPLCPGEKFQDRCGQDSAVENIPEANRLRVELLPADADVAQTLLGAAAVTDIEQDRTRRIAEAHKAYRTIVSMMGRLDPSPEQGRSLMEKVRLWLRRSGSRCRTLRGRRSGVEVRDG